MQMETKRKLGSCTSIRQNRLENKRDGGQGRASQDVARDGTSVYAGTSRALRGVESEC